MSIKSTAKGVQQDGEDELVLSGPFVMFNGSFIIEFLQPKKSRDASVLMRATYKHDHPWSKRAKDHPQSPPLHIHFQQHETFHVLSGEIGTTTTYGAVDTIHTPQNTFPKPFSIPAWIPHRFWPSPTATEDSVILVWADPNPDDMDDKMDRLFFQCLLGYVSDVAEGKEKMSLLQVMLMQHFCATALVMFPTVSLLGPLRWWIPWIFQSACAYVAMWAGYKPLIKKYMSPKEWEHEDVQRRVNMSGGKKDL